MTILHIRTQGAIVQRKADQIRITGPQKSAPPAQGYPIHTLEQIHLYGNVQLTTQAAALLLQHSIDIFFLSAAGIYRGRLAKDNSRSAQLRRRQLLMCGDLAQALPLATAIVQAKLSQQNSLLAHLVERLPAHTADLRRAMQTIAQMGRACGGSASLNALRGYEGKAAAAYFGVLRKLLDPAWRFQGRAYHPAPDPFNALLSFGYGMLAKDIEAVAFQVGLDPAAGFLHALEENRPSLVLDLMEEFRPVVVDHAMLHLVVEGHIHPADFTYTGQSTRPVELGTRLLDLVIGAYESRCDEIILHKPSSSQTTLRRCQELQAYQLAAVISGQRQRFEGIAST